MVELSVPLASAKAGATPLDLDEIAGLRLKGIATQGQLNAAEQANIIEAERWAFARSRDALDVATLQAVHRRMFGRVWSWAGEFRRRDKNIGIDWREIAVAMRQLVDDAIYWVNHRTYPADELAARFHHRLVAIHPFSNGNGRHARLAADILAIKLQQPRFTWGSGAPEARDRYLAALRAADAHDLAPLLAFVRS